MKINIARVSNWLINIGIVLSIFSFYVVYKTKKCMPAGVCPIDENNKLLYLSIFISLVGLVMSFIPNKKDKISHDGPK